MPLDINFKLMTSQAVLLTVGVLMVLGATVYMNYESGETKLSTIDHGFTADFASFIKSFDTKYDFIRSDITWSTYGYDIMINIL